MRFGKVLATVTGFLASRGHRFAVIGGIALVGYGLPRTTLDADLVVDAAAQDEILRFLESLGYQTIHLSRGYSNHAHPDPDWGLLDLVYVSGQTSEKLFASTRWLQGPGGLEIPVPKPEHLAALKVLAMKNDPARTFQELADIRFLLTLPGVDRQEVRAYFERHGLEESFHELETSL